MKADHNLRLPSVSIVFLLASMLCLPLQAQEKVWSGNRAFDMNFPSSPISELNGTFYCLKNEMRWATSDSLFYIFQIDEYNIDVAQHAISNHLETPIGNCFFRALCCLSSWKK